MVWTASAWGILYSSSCSYVDDAFRWFEYWWKAWVMWKHCLVCGPRPPTGMMCGYDGGWYCELIGSKSLCGNRRNVTNTMRLGNATINWGRRCSAKWLEQGGPDFMCTEDGKLVRNCNQVLTSSCENTILLSYFCYVTVTDSRRKGNRKGVGWRYFYSRFIVSKEREEVVGNWQLAIELPESVPTQQSTTSFCGWYTVYKNRLATR